MAKEKPSNNSEDILNKLKADLEEKEAKENLEIKKERIRLSQEQNKRFLEKKEKGQIFKAEDKLIEAIFPHYKKEKLEEDVPKIIMPNKKEQPIKIKDAKTKMPKVEKIDGKIGAPRVGSRFFMENEEKKMEEYTIIGTRIAKKDGQLLLRIKKNPEDREEEAKEINSKWFVSKFNKEKILLTIKDDKRIEELVPFSKKRKEENEEKRNKKEKDVLNKTAESADKTREELEKKEDIGINVGAEASKDLIKKGNRLGFNKTQINNMSVKERDLIRKATEADDVGDLWRKYNVSEPKTVEDLKSHHEIGKKMDEVLLKNLDDIEKKNSEEKEANKDISKDTKHFLKMERNKKYTQDKIELEERRHKEFADPKITDKDAITANPDMKALFKKDPEKFIEENKEKAILAFKYLNKAMKIEDLAKNVFFKKNNQNITGLTDEDFAKTEAGKWQFKFDEINKKYDDELNAIVSKEMKSRTQRTTGKMKEEWLKKEAAKTPFDRKIDTDIEEAKKKLREEINKSAEIAKEKIEEKIIKIHDKSEEGFKKIENEQKIKAEEIKDQARKEYIEAKNAKQPFWKFGFGSKKREQEIKEKEEAYMKAKKEYFEISGKDKMDFLLEEKQKFQTENIEKKGLSERIKNGIKGGMNLWENWDKNEKDSKFTQNIKRAGKTFVKIAIIGGASVVTVYGLAGLGIGTATALAGGIGSYVGQKAVMGTAFASMINMVPEKHRWWVSLGVTVPVVISGGITTVGIAGVAGIAGYMGSKLIKNKNEENIKKDVDAKIKALKEKKGEKIEKESFEDFEKRQNAIEKELELIEKKSNKDKFYRNIKKAVLALAIGTLTIEMSGAMQDYRDHHKPREYVPRDHDPIPKPIPHPTPTPEIHTLNPDAIIHKGEGIEHALTRQIEHSEELQKALHWDGKENLHHFAQKGAHILTMRDGYVDANGNEIHVNVADKFGYEAKVENGHISIYEKDLAGNLTDKVHHEGDAFEKDTEKYEYKTTGNTHIEKPVPVMEEQTIHPEKPTPVFENTQTNHPQELQPDAPRLQFEEREEPPLNLQYEHPQGDAGVMDPSSGVRNFNAFYTANHNEGPTNYQNGYNNGYQNNNVVYRNINPEQYYQNHIEHQHQIVEQATKLHDHNIHQIFPKSNEYGEYADKPVRDYLKMEPEDTENPAEKELINHIHKVHASTELRPRPGNLFRNPETIEHYLDRAYEEAIKQGKIKEVVIE